MGGTTFTAEALTAAHGAAHSSGASLKASETAPQRTPAANKILRPCFRPLKISRRVSAILAEAAPAHPAAWIIAAAEGQAERSARGNPPHGWIEALSDSFGTAPKNTQLAACRTALARGLPDAAWTDYALLGTLLLATRRHACERRSKQSGRAGRQSQPCVYTPTALARQMTAGVLGGAMRVVDPACGAGVFLIESFKRAFERRCAGGQEPLDAANSVLRNEISGVDIDTEALALAAFALRSAAYEASGLRENVPLDLRAADALQPLPGLDGRADVVLGNPPFVEGRGLDDAELAALRERFTCLAQGKVNLFAAFVERGLNMLRPGGVLCFLLPATFQRNERYRTLRELLLRHTLESIEPVEGPAFDDCVVETVILRVRKQPPARGARVALPGGQRPQRALPLGPTLRFCTHLPPDLSRQVDGMERRGTPLGDLFEVRDGISTGFQPFPRRLLGRVEDHVFIADDGTRAAFDPLKHMKVIDGAEFHAYTPVRWEGRWIEYDKTHEHVPPHPGRPFNCQLRERAIFDRSEKLLTRQTAKGLIATVDRERYFVRNSVHVTFIKPPHLPPRPGTPERRSPAGVCLTLESGRRASDRFARQFSLPALCACLNTSYYERYYLAVTGEGGKVFPQVHIADLKRLPLLPELLRTGGALEDLGEELFKLHAPGQNAGERIAELKRRVEELLKAAFEG